MRHTATVTSVSWIPSDSLRGALKTGMDLRLSHWDKPLPDTLSGPDELHELCRHDKFRFANLLSVWAEVEDGRVVDAGLDPGSGLVMGATTVRVGKIGATFRAAPLPVLRSEPAHEDGAVRFVQTVGGRTALPLPRPVPHPPYVRWQAPLVWTTLAVTLRPDGTSEVELAGASAFPRHWVYGPDGRVTLKSGLADQGALDGALLRGAHPVGGPRPAGPGGRRGESRWSAGCPTTSCAVAPAPRSATCPRVPSSPDKERPGGRALPRARRRRPCRRRRQPARRARSRSSPRRARPARGRRPHLDGHRRHPAAGGRGHRRRPSTSTASAPSRSRTTARTSRWATPPRRRSTDHSPLGRRRPGCLAPRW